MSATHNGTTRDGTSSRRFIFATGIENSYPVITGPDGHDVRRDGMELSGHYKHWREDFELVRELGIDYLRYGPPLYRVHVGPGKYDWSFPDETLPALRKLGITPIIDLCHFGVPDWVGDFQNHDWPEEFAGYAEAFARRYPWVRLYTPVNEIFIAASFSGLNGWWNERQSGDKAFVTALANLARANLLAEEAILRHQSRALFVQSESSEYFHRSGPETQPKADFYNLRRFLSLDLSYGYDVSGTMYEYLMDHGMTRDRYHWFLDRGQAMRGYCIMGNDYYITNEHKVLDAAGRVAPSGEIFGYYVITHQYFDRYKLPVMHTETNRKDAAQAPGWLWKEWSNIVRLKQDGVPLLGFTWYSLIDQTDWDTALREVNHRVNPCGLFDHDRKIRPVGKEYRAMIAAWRDLLPLESQYREIGTDRQPIPATAHGRRQASDADRRHHGPHPKPPKPRKKSTRKQHPDGHSKVRSHARSARAKRAAHREGH